MILISQADFAKKMGVSASAISQLKNKLPHQGKKLIMPDAERAYHLIKSGIGLPNTKVTPEVFAPGELTKSDGVDPDNPNVTMQDLLNAKYKKENVLGDIHKVNLKKMQGNLIAVDDVCKVVVGVCEIVRNELINLPTKIAPSLVGLSATEIQYALDDSMNEILTDLYNLQHEYNEQSNEEDLSADTGNI